MASQHPYRTLAVIGTVVVAEPLSATILFPFVFFMVRSFHAVDDERIGFWAGLITSSFFIPQMLTATLWGVASDRFGRKPIMLIGLLGSSISIVFFGLSTSLPWAIISRCVCGLFNGNAGVARTAVGELAHNHKLDQAKAFSLFGFCTAIGYLIGPLIGGLLSSPAEAFGISGPGRVFQQYPYLLPCLASGIYNIISALLTWGFFDETNQKLTEPAEPSVANDEHQAATDDDETTALLGNGHTSSDAPTKPQLSKANSFATTYCIIGITCISLHAIIFDEIYAIFSATTGGSGLSFSSSNIALSLSLMGPIVFLVQLVVYPALSNRFTALTLWRASSFVFATVYPLFSLLPHLSQGGQDAGRAAQWAILILLLAVRFAANVVAYTSIAILLNKVALPSKRGAIMGLGQTAISLGRAAGPALGGLLWSWSLTNGLPAPFDAHFLFCFEMFIALAQWATSMLIQVDQ